MNASSGCWRTTSPVNPRRSSESPILEFETRKFGGVAIVVMCNKTKGNDGKSEFSGVAKLREFKVKKQDRESDLAGWLWLVRKCEMQRNKEKWLRRRESLSRRNL